MCGDDSEILRHSCGYLTDCSESKVNELENAEELTGKEQKKLESFQNNQALYDEIITTHRTRTSDGEEDLVECPHCHEMRDSKAYYCRHCNMPF